MRSKNWNAYNLKWFLFAGSIHGAKRYDTSKEIVNKFSVRFYIIIGVWFVIVLGMPFYVVLYHVIRGTYTPSVWFLPYKVMYVWKDEKLVFNSKQKLFFSLQFSSFPCVSMPFEQNKGVGYAVTLAIQILSIFIVGSIMCLLNSLFFAICWYVDTFIQDLCDILKRNDDLWNQNQKPKQGETMDFLTHLDRQSFSNFQEFLTFNEDIFR